jgi:hypothetical protein
MDNRFAFIYRKALVAGIPRDRVLEAWNAYQARMVDRWVDSHGCLFAQTSAFRQWWKYLCMCNNLPFLADFLTAL